MQIDIDQIALRPNFYLYMAIDRKSEFFLNRQFSAKILKPIQKIIK
jgi:hypothetical protein